MVEPPSRPEGRPTSHLEGRPTSHLEGRPTGGSAFTPTPESVGPVLESGPAGACVIAAIRTLNHNVTLEDHGSYVRVLVPRRCVVTRAAIEAITGEPFRLPGDLEMLMPSFKGRFLVNDDQATWTVEHAR